MEEGESCEEITAKIRAAKYRRRSLRYQRRIKRMPYGGCTVNVGVREEMESHIDLIHGGAGEIVHIAHRQGVRQSNHSGSLGELSTDHERCWRHDPFGQGVRLGPIRRWSIFPHQAAKQFCLPST